MDPKGKGNVGDGIGIQEMAMDIGKREDIEWLNYWIEDASTDKKRIILLGDSVTRELRKKLQFYMRRDYAVDLIAMSYCILDDMVLEEVGHYFLASPYEYESIIYQMGAHHGYHIACSGSLEDAEDFACRTVEILSRLKQYSAHVIAVSSTPERCFDKEGNRLFNHNREIAKRNRILGNAAQKAQVAFFDLNQKINGQDLRYLDWCHFYEECYSVIARIFLAEFFPDIPYIPSNQIETVRELDEKLKLYKDKKVYVYGNGIRGRRIRTYLCRRGYRFDGFVVSDEYMDLAGQAFGIDEIKNENTLIIVTPVEIGIWEKLEQNQFDYITLHSDVNTFLRMYAEM